jgi:Mor family transcriptional regulator
MALGWDSNRHEDPDWSQLYSNKYIGKHGRGKVSGRSMDIARTVLMEPGSSYASVANRYGVSRQRVGQIVRRMGVARRRPLNAV